MRCTGQRESGTSVVALSRAASSNEEVGRMFLRATLTAAAVLITTAICSASPAYSSPGGGGGCYIAASGDCVPYPQKGGPQPPGATAQCADGSWSFSEH